MCALGVGGVRFRVLLYVLAILFAVSLAWGLGGTPVALASTAHITGNVTDAATGDPVEGIGADALIQDGSDWYSVGLSGSTDSLGDYDISYLYAGTYKVEFWDASGTYASQYYQGKTTLAAANSFTLVASEVKTGINAALVSAAHITGTVTDAATTDPVASIWVGALRLDGSDWVFAALAWTDSFGEYDIGGLAAGTYKVQFEDWMSGVYARQYYNAKTTEAAANTFTLTAGQLKTGINAGLVERARITGAVTDVADGDPVEGTFVEAYIQAGTAWEVAGGAITEFYGDYLIDGLAAGTYKVGFYGYDDVVEQYYNGKTTMGTANSFTLVPGQEKADINGTVSTGAHITGNVTDAATTNPLENIWVEAQIYVDGWWETQDSGYTDSNGDYDLGLLPAGGYIIRFDDSYYSYAPQYYSGKTTQGAADSFALAEDEIKTGIDAAMAAAAHITGHVSDAVTTDPLSNITVLVYDQASPWEGAITGVYPDSLGDYDIGGLAAGTYIVRFIDYSGTYAQQYYNAKTTMGEADDVLLAAGETETGINAAMSAAAHITGNVTDATTTDPLYECGVGAYVWNAYGWDWAEMSMTDSLGDYDIGGLPTGTYIVEFWDQYGAFAGQYYNAKTTMGEADTFTLAVGETKTGINAALDAAAHITGTVTAAGTGAPLGNIEVAAYLQIGSEWDYADTGVYTDPYSGEYDIAGLSAGTYKVEFNDWNGDYAGQYYNGKTDWEAADTFTLTVGETKTGVNAALTLGAHITGTVTDAATTDPLRDVYVDAYVQTGSSWDCVAETPTGFFGEYDLGGLPAGTYKVEFYDWNGDYVGQYYNGKATWETADTFTLALGGTKTGVDAALVSAAHITGHVSDAVTALPVAGIWVDAFQDGGSEWTSVSVASTDSSGDYDIGGLAAGTYIVGFYNSDSGDYAFQYYDGQISMAGADSFTLAVGETKTNVSAIMVAAAHITGTVTDAYTSDPVSGVWVPAYNQSGSDWIFEGGAETDVSGDYDIGGLAAGTYHVGFCSPYWSSSGSEIVEYYYDRGAVNYDVDGGDDVIVGAGATVPDIDAALVIAPPAITSLDPIVGDVAGGTSVVITGTDFTGVNSVTFGGTEATSFTFDSDTQITAVAPAHAAGAVQVCVTTWNGPSADTTADDFAYLAPTLFDQSSAKITYLGSWATSVSAGAYGGSFAYTASSGAAAVVEFTGTSVTLRGKRGPARGIALVSVDGGAAEEADLYRSTYVEQDFIYGKTGLDYGAHTLTIQYSGTKNASATGYTICLDSLEVLGALDQADPTTRYEEDDGLLSYAGTWTPATSATASDGAYTYTATDAGMNVRFEGTHLTLLGKVGPARGKALVSLDGALATEIDFYNASYLDQKPVYATGLLTYGVHDLTISWAGTKNPSATGYTIVIDAFDILGTLTTAPTASVPTRFEQSDPKITYLGSWATAASAAASGGSFAYTASPGAAAVVEFTGTSVTLRGKTGPARGIALVSIEGGVAEEADLYRPGVYTEQDVFFEKTGLAYGTYTLTIAYSGTKNPSASGYTICLDALQILGTLDAADTISRYEENDLLLTWAGTWTPAASATASSGAFTYTSTDAGMNVEFTGTHLTLLGKVGPARGKALVSVDGAPATEVDFYNATYVDQKPVYATGLLTYGVHDLTLTWAGLKNLSATAYTIVVDALDVLGGLNAAPPVSLPTRYEQTDPKITYLGSWSTAASAAASGGSFAYTASPGAAVVVEFTGTSITLRGKTGPARGVAVVKLDGDSEDVDLYRASYTEQDVIYEKAGLADIPHTLTIAYSGTKNASATGYTICLDALQILGTLDTADTTTRYEENDALLTKAGTWTPATSAAASGGSFIHTSTDAALNVRFEGTHLTLLGKVGPARGKALVSVDNGPLQEIDFYNASYLDQQKVYTTGLLPTGMHDLSFTWAGTKNPSATAYTIAIDAFDVLGTLDLAHEAVLPTRYEQTDPKLTYLGSWTTAASAGASGGSFSYTVSPGAAVSLEFTGPSITLRGKTGPARGIAFVSLDGGAVEEADLYRPSVYTEQDVFYHKEGLDNIPHTLTIAYSGTKHPSASGYTICLDALQIVGTLDTTDATTRYEETDTLLAWTGTWTTAASAAASSGAFTHTASAGVCYVEFNGTHLTLLGKVGPARGKALVSVDDNPATEVDFYNASYVDQKPVYATGLLPPGVHDLTITWAGLKNPAASSYTIAIDAFDVLGSLSQAVVPAP